MKKLYLSQGVLLVLLFVYPVVMLVMAIKSLSRGRENFIDKIDADKNEIESIVENTNRNILRIGEQGDSQEYFYSYTEFQGDTNRDRKFIENILTDYSSKIH